MECWICGFAIGRKRDHRDLHKSRDHVIPRMAGGTYVNPSVNIRWAHRICNEYKAHGEVTPELVAKCRARVVSRGAKERKPG